MIVYICANLCVGSTYKINFTIGRIWISEKGAQMVTEKFHMARLSHLVNTRATLRIDTTHTKDKKSFLSDIIQVLAILDQYVLEFSS